MAGCEYRIEINAPAEIVWAMTQDCGKRPSWDYRISRVSLVGAEAAGKGVTVRSEGSMLGPFLIEMQYVAFEPYSRSAVKLTRVKGMPIEGGGGSWRYERLENGGCRFTTKLQFMPRKMPFAKAADRLVLEPVIRWMTRKSLAKLKMVCEEEAAKAAETVESAKQRASADKPILA